MVGWIKINTDGSFKSIVCVGYMRVDWNNCLWCVRHMRVFVSHMFHNDNCVAYALANFGANHAAYCPWSNVPSCVASAFIIFLLLPNIISDNFYYMFYLYVGLIFDFLAVLITCYIFSLMRFGFMFSLFVFLFLF